MRAHRGRVARLLRVVEDLFDALMVLRVPPGFEKVADGVDLQHVLEGHRDLRSHDLAERQIEDWIAAAHVPTRPTGPVYDRNQQAASGDVHGQSDTHRAS